MTLSRYSPRWIGWAVGLGVLVGSPIARAQPAGSATAPGGPQPLRSAGPARTWADAVFVDVTTSFVPYANDVPIMVGIGVRFARCHELWARAGYIPVGDDRRYGVGSGGYRVALRPRKIVRPIFGGLVAAVPAICDHDAQGRTLCTPTPLFILAGTAGVRLEPVPWLGLFSALTIGTDSYPHPFGMVELGVSFAMPQS